MAQHTPTRNHVAAQLTSQQLFLGWGDLIIFTTIRIQDKWRISLDQKWSGDFKNVTWFSGRHLWKIQDQKKCLSLLACHHQLFALLWLYSFLFCQTNDWLMISTYKYISQAPLNLEKGIVSTKHVWSMWRNERLVEISRTKICRGRFFFALSPEYHKTL